MTMRARFHSVLLAMLLGRASSIPVRSQPHGGATVRGGSAQLLEVGLPYDFDDVHRDAAGVSLEGFGRIPTAGFAVDEPATKKHFFTEKDCASGMFRSEKACKQSWKKPVYLASYPCSGNTWARSVLEGVLLIYSGSIYNDTNLTEAGFLGEGSADPRRVFPIKTHWPVIGNHSEDSGLKHLVIVREPLHAALSWCHLEDGDNHHLETPREDLEAAFAKNVEYNLREWTNMAYTFMHRTDVRVVRYEDIVRNASHVYRTEILPYLGVNPNHPDVRERLLGAIERSDGAYQTTRRKHTYTFQFNKTHMDLARKIIGAKLARHYGYCLNKKCGLLP